MFTTQAKGKFLLTGEYFVLDGALALAVPLRFGQTLEVQEGTAAGILEWTSLGPDGKPWFEASFSLPDFQIQHSSDSATADTLAGILRRCSALNPGFFTENQSFKVKTQNDFPREWGLGTSSTLIAALGCWTGADPYTVLFQTLGGSGYDLACAYAQGPILYRLNGKIPEITPLSTPLFPGFSEQLYFIYLGKKQNSREGIARYRQLGKNALHLELVDELSRRFISATNLDELDYAIQAHETLVGQTLQLPLVKTQYFSDFWGQVKSLGAWGGDFVLATSRRPEAETRAYFQQKGFDVFLPWREIVL